MFIWVFKKGNSRAGSGIATALLWAQRSKASDRNVRPTKAVAAHRVCEVDKATESSMASDKNVRPTRAVATHTGRGAPGLLRDAIFVSK
jgi:hypothetical protein